MMASPERESLVWLQTNWGDYYVIKFADGVWSADRVSNPAMILTADSARELRDKMRDDYAEQASQRHSRGPAEGGSL